MSAYGKFASCYDELTGNVDYLQMAEYLHRVLEKHQVQNGILLDLACGTGTLCETFAGFGYEMIGVDASEEMLSEAMNKKYESGSDIIYLCQKMQDLDLYGTIDAAFCTMDSINHLNSISDVRKAFERVSLFLNPGGIFVFDCNSIYKHQHILADNTFVYDCEDVYCVWQNTLLSDNRVGIHLDIFELDGKKYIRSEEEFCETAFSENEIISCLKETGLEVLLINDGYSDMQPCKTTQRFVYVARKGE